VSGVEKAGASKRKQNLVGLFNRVAPIYDRVGPKVFSHFGGRLVEMACLFPGASVLDVATGRGAVLFPASQAVGETGKVVGIDLSAGMARETAAEVDRLQLGNIAVRQMDAEQLAFANHTFDFVFCGFAIFMFPETRMALAEMQRVLRPGGRIALSLWDRKFFEQLRWLNQIVRAYLFTEDGSEGEGEGQARPETDLHTVEGARKLLERVGFKEVQIREETAAIEYQDPEEWWSSLWTHGMRASLERVRAARGEAGLDKLKSEVVEELKSRHKLGRIEEKVPVLLAVAVKPDS
jgi:ubiquinone/menaquinone biosynthesis C-methylase UbiE